MIAADTNVVLRLILQDDSAQLELIEAVLLQQRLFVPLTVFLETGWVLASRYQLSREEIVVAMTALLDLDRVEIARAGLVQWAVDRFAAGADWADMLHLVAAHKLGHFLTFDRALARRAGAHCPLAVQTLA